MTIANWLLATYYPEPERLVLHIGPLGSSLENCLKIEANGDMAKLLLTGVSNVVAAIEGAEVHAYAVTDLESQLQIADNLRAFLDDTVP